MCINVEEIIEKLTEDIVELYDIETPISDMKNVVTKLGGKVVATDTLQSRLKRDENSFTIEVPFYTATKKLNYFIVRELGHLFLHMILEHLSLVTMKLSKEVQILASRNNQNFVNIPYGQLREKLEYLCKLNSISYVKQEESYTSKSSFWDKDEIPVYNADNPKEYTFSGNRIDRGLYKTAGGKTFNADVNGALNTMRKSSVVYMNILYSRGEVDTPIRIRIA